MITCPNCAHLNPDGAVNCEACFTPLPIVKSIQCPSCNATVLSDAKFCGHCGFNLNSATAINPHQEVKVESKSIERSVDPSTEVFPVLPISSAMSNSLPDETTEGNNVPDFSTSSSSAIPTIPMAFEADPLLASQSSNLGANVAAAPTGSVKTQLQQFSASLLHVQTNLTIEIPAHLPVVHIGKPNTVIPPDIDVSGFPDSDIVSRIHADIRAEGGAFYFEDTGSSNGTYINNLPLPAGNRHKLRAGDRISLGKGDKVSFVFQLSS
ncbi:MAG: phosphopeptide-binding protein [Pseudanabaena frigida]|uniref:Phosphopeptide-binding protein n=1 Tax=Pseudanabaena frigida TaxID=945775 RepID=A0A2W4WII5_9CYAN|nr:MAG: phosphopeptide-binding protein [Pseudanabaena frigida]